MKISKINILSISLIGFLFVGLLLLTGHPGIAIKITNYLFFVLLAIIIYEKIFKK